MNELRLMQGQIDESSLGQGELYVLAMLREVIAISEAEQKSTRSDARCNCNERKQPKPQRNTGHDEEGHLALLGYCK